MLVFWLPCEFAVSILSCCYSFEFDKGSLAIWNDVFISQDLFCTSLYCKVNTAHCEKLILPVLIEADNRSKDSASVLIFIKNMLKLYQILNRDTIFQLERIIRSLSWPEFRRFSPLRPIVSSEMLDTAGPFSALLFLCSERAVVRCF